MSQDQIKINPENSPKEDEELYKGTSKNRRFQPATVSSGLKSSGLPVL